MALIAIYLILDLDQHEINDLVDALGELQNTRRLPSTGIATKQGRPEFFFIAWSLSSGKPGAA